MNERCGRRFRSSLSAARFVTQTDGEYHGLDVVDERSGGPTGTNGIYVSFSCGQIREELSKFFPEAGKFYRCHLDWNLTPEVFAWFDSIEDGKVEVVTL